MKHLLLSTFMLLTTLAFAQPGQIANGGFENWTLQTLFENPDDWRTGNYEQPPYITVTKSSDSQHGNQSIRMESMINGNDSLFGYIIHGDIGDNGPEGGIPYTSVVDTFKFWTKYDIQPGDSATVAVFLKNGGIPFTFDVFKIPAGTQSSWMQMAYPINPGLMTPDSVVIAFASSNAFEEDMRDGSWLMIDNVEFASSQGAADPIPNFSFENWSDVELEEADGYHSISAITAAAGITPVRKTTDANSGSFAVELETSLFQFGNETDTIHGVMTNGTLTQQMITGGVPYTASPTSFNGYYKYSPVGQDTGRVVVLFKNGGNIVGVAGHEATSNINTYTAFSHPLFIPTTPDTMLLTIWSGNNPGSILHVDDLSLSGGNVGIQYLDADDHNIMAYPNPAIDRATISYHLNGKARVALTLTDVEGRLIQQQTFERNNGLQQIALNLNDVEAGVYIYTLTINDKVFTDKLVVSK